MSALLWGVCLLNFILNFIVYVAIASRLDEVLVNQVIIQTQLNCIIEEGEEP